MNKKSRGVAVAGAAALIVAVAAVDRFWSDTPGPANAPLSTPVVRDADRAAPPPAAPRGPSSGKEPPQDLLAAIRAAQDAAGRPAGPAPPGRASWQGMSNEEAAKVFEEAAKARSNPEFPKSPFR